MAEEQEQSATTLRADIDIFTDALQTEVQRLAGSMHAGTNYVLRVTMPAQISTSWVLGLADDCFSGECEYIWCAPTEGVYLVGCGIAAELKGSGEQRFTQISEQMQRYVVSEAVLFPNLLPPLWFGGYSFDAARHGPPWESWPDARFVMAEWQFLSGEESTLTYQTVVQRDTDLQEVVSRATTELQKWLDNATPMPRSGAQQAQAGAPEEWASDNEIADNENDDNDIGDNEIGDNEDYKVWRTAVEATAADIQNGKYRKAVLARCRELDLQDSFRISASVGYLTNQYPESVTFLIRQDDEVFLGASPERLVDVIEGQVHVDCLAGSIRRGQTQAEDNRYGEQLLASAKDRHEHAVVVDWVVTSIAEFVTDLDLPAVPVLRKLANVQHLYTPVHGKLTQGDVLELVERLHPTPAVAGDPRRQALAVIAQREPLARGWYAGAVGMVAANGDGIFIVGLRSGLLTPERARLFAGAGIMAESVAQTEWQETKWKMQPMQAAVEQS